MTMILLSFLATAQAECENWGQIAQDNAQTLYLEDSLTLSVADAECGDLDSCLWEILSPSNGGDLSSSTGEQTVYTPPSELSNCQAITVEVSLTCNDLSGQYAVDDQIDIQVQCSDDDLASLTGPSSWKPSGGGCNSPQYSFFLLLPLLIRRKKINKRQR